MVANGAALSSLTGKLVLRAFKGAGGEVAREHRLAVGIEWRLGRYHN